MQYKAIEAKRIREAAMAVQTKDMVRTSHVLLLSIQDYINELIIVDNIVFSTCMMDLMERPGVANIVNQVTQFTQDYNCSPHIHLWLKLVKINGFLALTGVRFGSFSSWLFRPGHQTILEDQNNNRLNMAAKLEGEGKISVKDLNKNLGSTA